MKPTVVFQTDFGSGGGGVLAGVVKTIDPEVSVYDFDHNIEPFNIRQSAYQISTMIPYWPSGTIFVSVVDPGVGTHRKSCVAKLKNGSYVVTPDNGILTSIIDDIVECIDDIIDKYIFFIKTRQKCPAIWVLKKVKKRSQHFLRFLYCPQENFKNWL